MSARKNSSFARHGPHNRRCLTSKLQANFFVNPVNTFGIYLPALSSQHIKYAPITITNAAFVNLFDANFQTGPTATAGFGLIGRSVELQHSAGASDRHAPVFSNIVDNLALTIPFRDIAAPRTAGQRTSEFSYDDTLQQLLVQYQICDDLLQAPVLIF